MDAIAFEATSRHCSFYHYHAFARNLQVTIIAIFVLSFLVLTPFPALPVESPIHFTDVTDIAGIHFTHTNGALGEFHLPETLGSGVHSSIMTTMVISISISLIVLRQVSSIEITGMERSRMSPRRLVLATKTAMDKALPVEITTMTVM